ncbi:Asp23/Gls24 family envelope stress response protein [Rothia dentocariosa]|uniref:Asp23/Gls24 family envelope stress response protein n=1 Tax=Rothia dentocariosa TaxID=2047 RepID=UPI00203F4489|nr:Asp23/Gls24 family envelope stress response protein [Rothia dentocariosa]MCM3438818.1 Asp23/Gls24 family envelope stress response protein [Rothia dentocariosa]
MTETNTQSAAVSAEGSHEESPWQGQRGVTVIPAQVVAQIAAQAAYESANVGSNAGGLLGIGARRNFHSRPEAKCDLYGQVAVLHLDLGLTFPTALVSTLQQLREHVSQRVERLTGLRVEKINIEVSWLNPNNQVRKALR